MRASQTRKSFVGQVVDDRYEVSAELGEGAVGMVYRAVDRSSGRPVALKIWHETARDPQTRGRFIRELAALSVLKHPNIVEVYGYGVVDESPYVAMEVLQGQTLDDLIGDGDALSPPLAFQLFGQVMDALAFAHQQNVVHRDLKPENIFLVPTPEGGHSVRILDYGLAKFLAPGADPLKGAAITMTGMVMGTPLYMPPEQAAGAEIDLRADVYAAGCIFFEMLTGRLPYLGENQMELLRAHMQAPIPQIGEVLEDKHVAPELQAVIDRALAKKTDGRYGSAGEMREAVQQLGPSTISAGSGPGTAGAGDTAGGGRPSAMTEPMPAPTMAQGGRGALVYGGLAAALIVLGAMAWTMLR